MGGNVLCPAKPCNMQRGNRCHRLDLPLKRQIQSGTVRKTMTRRLFISRSKAALDLALQRPANGQKCLSRHQLSGRAKNPRGGFGSWDFHFAPVRRDAGAWNIFARPGGGHHRGAVRARQPPVASARARRVSSRRQAQANRFCEASGRETGPAKAPGEGGEAFLEMGHRTRRVHSSGSMGQIANRRRTESRPLSLR